MSKLLSNLDPSCLNLEFFLNCEKEPQGQGQRQGEGQGKDSA